MRTTLNLDDSLMKAAKRLASERGTTLTKVVEGALRGELNPGPEAVEAFELEIPIVTGRRSPVVDVADRRALYDLIEPVGEPG